MELPPDMLSAHSFLCRYMPDYLCSFVVLWILVPCQPSLWLANFCVNVTSKRFLAFHFQQDTNKNIICFRCFCLSHMNTDIRILSLVKKYVFIAVSLSKLSTIHSFVPSFLSDATFISWDWNKVLSICSLHDSFSIFWFHFVKQDLKWLRSQQRLMDMLTP